MKLSRIAFRNVGRNKRRSILSGIAIGVAAMAIVILFSLLSGMQADLASNLQDFYSGMVRVRHAEYTANEMLSPLHLRVGDLDERLATLDSLPEVESVAPRIRFPASIYLEGETFSAQGLGVDIEREVRYSQLDAYLVSGVAADTGSKEAMIGNALADRLGVEVGDSITVLTVTMTRGSNAMTFIVSGIVQLPVDALNSNTVLVPIATARDLLRMDNSATEVLVKLTRERESAAVAQRLRAMWDADLSIESWRDIPSAYTFIEWARNIYNGMAVFFFLLGSTVIITTTMIVIFERMREIGTIAAMGMTGKEIVRLFFLESLFIAMIAAAVGVLLGSGISLALGVVGIDMADAMEGIDIEIGSSIFPQWSLPTAIFVYFYSVIITGLAAFFPARRAAKVEPVEALHTV